MNKSILYYLPVGTKVHDDLTGQTVTIIGVTFKTGAQGSHDTAPTAHAAIGYWVDHEWADGGRHPWEITEIE